MTERFKKDFKDEIPQGGFRTYDLVNERGNIIQQNMRLVRHNGNEQEGDEFTSVTLNDMMGFLNGLLSGVEKVKSADNAKIVPWSGITNAPFNQLAFLRMTINTFSSSSKIYGRVYVGENWNGCNVLANILPANGTPMNQVTNVQGQVGSGVLEVYAYGSFVNGHMLSVAVMLEN